MKTIYLRGLTLMDKLHTRIKANIKPYTIILSNWSQHACLIKVNYLAKS